MTAAIRHLQTDTPRVMVVDGSRVVRRLIEQVLRQQLPGVEVVSCGTGEEARIALHGGAVDLVTTALQLPDMDGLTLASVVRNHALQAYIPIIVVSGDVQERLEARSFSDDVTDYFDKSLGVAALATFIRGYVRPEAALGGALLYVEDSRVVAAATRRMLEKHGLDVTHVFSAEEGIAHLDSARAEGRGIGADLVLTDVYLREGMSGKDLLRCIRHDFGYAKGQLPVVVMTGDANPANQGELLRMGANDLVQKPIDERLLLTKLLFQMRVGQMQREKLGVKGSGSFTGK